MWLYCGWTQYVKLSIFQAISDRKVITFLRIKDAYIQWIQNYFFLWIVYSVEPLEEGYFTKISLYIYRNLQQNGEKNLVYNDMSCNVSECPAIRVEFLMITSHKALEKQSGREMVMRRRHKKKCVSLLAL